MNELMSSTDFWFVTMWISLVGLVVILVVAVVQWLNWTIINLEGAGRKVFVGVHGCSGDAVVYPEPEKQEKTTFYMSPLVRPYAFVNPDRDEVRILVAFAPEGAAASTDDKDEPVATLRISWTVSAWVPFFDIPGDPGDHGRLPENLKMPIGKIKKESKKRFKDRNVEDLLPKKNQKLKYCIPGAAAIAFMNKYTEGEHMARMFEFVTQHARDLLASLSVQELMRVRELEEGAEGSDPKMTKLDYAPRIRDRVFPLTAPCLKIDGAEYEYSSMSELQQAISRLLTRVCQLALEPYGVFINDITFVRIQLPARLVEASRDREAREEDKKALVIFADGMGETIGTLTDKGMSKDVAGLVLADAVGKEGGAGPLAALLTIVKRIGGG